MYLKLTKFLMIFLIINFASAQKLKPLSGINSSISSLPAINHISSNNSQSDYLVSNEKPQWQIEDGINLAFKKKMEEYDKSLAIDEFIGENLDFDKSNDHASALNCYYGIASYYGTYFHGRQMANGETYNMWDKTTAAHLAYPFGTKLKVTNPNNNKSIIVTIKDRGPYIAGRELDLSYAAAKELEPNISTKGLLRVKIQPLSSSFIWPTSLSGHGYKGFGYKSGHRAIDIDGVNGQPVYAVANGYIIAASRAGDLGNRIIIDHKNGYRSVYGHLNNFVTHNGYVRQGQVIGYIGNTGHVIDLGGGGYHLHFELINNGRRQNPLAYLKK